jgi:putative membrane protein
MTATSAEATTGLVSGADAQWGSDHMGGDWDWDGGGWFAMFFTMVFVWSVIGAVVVYALRSGRGDRSAGQPAPLDIAAGRYARGEIDDEEFERIKQGLRK